MTTIRLPSRNGSNPQRRQRGLTLVELMVGLTLGMIMSTALLVLFANASSNGQNVQRASVHIENGRYATELLRDELQMAGYYGEAPSAVSSYVTPDACLTDPAGAFVAAPLRYPTPVRGYTASETIACLGAYSRLAGTDAVAVRRLDVQSVAVSTLPATGQQYHLQHSLCSTDPVNTPLVFDKNRAAFTLQMRNCTAANTVRPYVSRLYFVASCSRCGAGGDSTPTLKRLDLVGNTLVETALVEGVESFRLEYGFDTNGDGSPDDWRTSAAGAGAASQWENVMAITVHMIVRSTERVTGASLARAQTFQLGRIGSVSTANDGFARRAYSSTVRLINPSGAREAQ